MRQRSPAIALFSAALFVAGTTIAAAKPPTLTGFFPAGAARGQSATVTMSGTFGSLARKMLGRRYRSVDRGWRGEGETGDSRGRRCRARRALGACL